MLESLILPGSTFAGKIDQVVDVVGVLVFFWFGVTVAMFFWLLWRFRYQEGVKALYVNGTEPDLKRWINIPHYMIIVCDIAIIAFAVNVWYMVKQDMPKPNETVEVISQQWAWTFVQPGKDGQLGTDDDIKTTDELHVLVDQVSQFKLESRDVLHSFSVPVFRIKQDAIPGRVISGWFEPTVVGNYDIQCTEICGIGHGVMEARIYVETPEQHAAWIAAASPK
jgi:cytochrome c oxidase subunit 2